MFDIDGTLLDSMAPLVLGLAETYEHFGVPRPSDEEILATLGTPLRVQLTMFGLGEAEPDVMKQRTDYAIGRFEANAHLEREFAPAIDALKQVYDAGLRVALVTSKSRQEIDLLMTRFRGGKWAHAIVCSSDVTQPKPSGESARLACRRLGVRPDEALLIGDSVFDIHCARDAGTAAVAVAYGASTQAILAAERPDALFRTPEALRDWIAQTLLKPHGKKEFQSATV